MASLQTLVMSSKGSCWGRVWGMSGVRWGLLDSAKLDPFTCMNCHSGVPFYGTVPCGYGCGVLAKF